MGLGLHHTQGPSDSERHRDTVTEAQRIQRDRDIEKERVGESETEMVN